MDAPQILLPPSDGTSSLHTALSWARAGERCYPAGIVPSHLVQLPVVDVICSSPFTLFDQARWVAMFTRCPRFHGQRTSCGSNRLGFDRRDPGGGAPLRDVHKCVSAGLMKRQGV